VTYPDEVAQEAVGTWVKFSLMKSRYKLLMVGEQSDRERISDGDHSKA
jgi:hypothetical protein